MSSPLYEVGQIVKLKSGGPSMTVKNVHRHYTTKEFLGTYHCQWFAGKKLDSGDFPEKSLVTVDSDD